MTNDDLYKTKTELNNIKESFNQVLIDVYVAITGIPFSFDDYTHSGYKELIKSAQKNETRKS